jgi:hypothetical protein
MVASTDTSIAALPDLATYVAALNPVVAAWAALPADKASVLDSATQAITDLSLQVTQARRPSPGRRHAHCTVLPQKLSLAPRAACLTRHTARRRQVRRSDPRGHRSVPRLV